MKMRILLLGVAGAAIASAGLWAWSHHARDAEPTRALATTHTAAAATVSPDGVDPVTLNPRTSKQMHTQRNHHSRVVTVPAPPTSATVALQEVAQAYACAACGADDPFAAKSAAEAAWKSSRGFPTQDQLQHMQTLNRTTLRTLSDHGDTVATGLLGTILLQDGQTNEATGLLYKAMT